MRERSSLWSMNRGVVSHLGLARLDVKRLALAAETQDNWVPRVLGPMTLRPGTKYIGASYLNQAARYLRFVFATDDVALLELTTGYMRVWIDDEVLTRPSVSTTITNGTFDTDLASWTDYDDGGATSSWASPGYMQLVGSGTTRAIREQVVANGSPNIEHALRIVVARGPVMLRVGSTSGGDEYVAETTLHTGTHSISFTPSTNFYVRFFSRAATIAWVDECTIEAAGEVLLPTPWTTTTHLNAIRYDQSGDTVYVACEGLQQRRIERRGTRPGARSWSVATYAPTDGPFLVENVTPTTIAASALTGNVTLTASIPLFKSGHVGALYSLTSSGQTVTVSASAENTFSSSIRVTGLTADRGIAITVSGTFTATVTLQRSFDNATWYDVSLMSWTAATSESYNDSLDNYIAYYRIGIKTGDYTSGTAVCELRIAQGSIRGVARITAVATSTSASAEILSDLGGTSATSTWQEGKWSDERGWPTSVRIHEGRLWWAGLNGVWGSVSDAYDSFDETYPGDAGPINRTIGSGPVDVINWILSLKAMLLGAQGSECTVRASSLDEPLTPTNFNIKVTGTQGSANVDAVKVDQSGLFVDRSGTKVFDVSFDVRGYDYLTSDLMQLCPEIGLGGITRIDVQRKPDTRLRCVRADGTVLVAVMSKTEEMLAWYTESTSGEIEDVVVLPALAGELDDRVYYLVKRRINGSEVRYLEQIAQELDCRGDNDLCMLADAHAIYDGAATTTITGLDHLEGEPVVVWADGADVGTIDTVYPWVQTYAVSSGQIELAEPASRVVVGLPYSSQFKSAKLGSLGGPQSPLNEQKRIDHIGMVLANTHSNGLLFGPDFDNLDTMPQDGVTAGEVYADYDEQLIEFGGIWTTDARVCIEAHAPRPATVLGVTINMRRS